MTNRCDILVLVWGMKGRDPEALIPVIYLLKEKYKLKVIVKSMFEFSAIDLYKPKILYLNGCTGSKLSYNLTKYAFNRGIYVVSNHAEGVFRKKIFKDQLWGWNIEKRPTVDKYFLWNKNAYDWSLQSYPEIYETLEVSGSIGHEKYRFLLNMNPLSSTLKKKFNGMLLYIGWDFGAAIDRFKNGKEDEDPRISRKYTIDYLKFIAKTYEDKLLVLKYHPGVTNEQESEIYNYFDEFSNVLILHNEYPLYDLIFASDLILVFDSTATIDSWMAGKETITFYKGDQLGYNKTLSDLSTLCQNKNHLFEIIEYFDNNNSLDISNEKREERKIFIETCFGDQKKSPSLHVAKHIANSLNHNKKKKIGLSKNYIKLGLKNIFYYYLPLKSKFKSNLGMRNHYKPKSFKKQYNFFKPYLKEYYSKIDE
jgi:surface carbohydrate biosynthesis protein